MATDSDAPRSGTDPLKYYCVIFLVMVALLTVLFFKLRGDRLALEAANRNAKAWFDENLPRNERDDRPNDIPSLAFEVEQLVSAYVAAGGEDAGTISEARMKGFALTAGMQEMQAGAESSDPNRNRGYTTLTRTYTYDASTLGNLVRLAYAIDSSARYRVMELVWQLKRKQDGNSVAPFDQIGKSSIKVALRKAIPKGI